MLRIIRWWDQISGKSPTLYSYKLGTRHLPFLPDFWWRHVHSFSLTPDDDGLELGLDTPAFSLTFWELLTPIPTTALYRSDNTNLLHWPGVGNNSSLGQSSGARCVHKEKLVWNTMLKCFQHEEKLVWNTKLRCFQHSLKPKRNWTLVWNTKVRHFQHSLKPVWYQVKTCLKHEVEMFSAQSYTCMESSENLSETQSWGVCSTISNLSEYKMKPCL